MSEAEAGKLIKFPQIGKEKIEFGLFLSAAKGLSLLVDDLGRIFAPLSYDMGNNITKLYKGNAEPKCTYIEDLLLLEKTQGGGSSADALLWLKRALHFFLVFFQILVNDPDGPDSMESVMAAAYEATLKPHHGWVTRQLFAFFKSACPSRTMVIEILRKRMEENVEVLPTLKEYCSPLAENIKHIDAFFDQEEFNLTHSVP